MHFYTNPSLEVRGLFLDLSKTSDRIWQEGVLYKLKSSGIYSNLLNLTESFPHNRRQRVALKFPTGNL